MTAAALAALAAGAAVTAGTLVEVFEVMLLPRRVRRRRRFVRAYFRTVWHFWRGLADRPLRRWRDELLAAFGPLAMIGLLGVWTVALVTGFGLVHWALARGAAEPPSLVNQLYFSGTTFFTLGLGDVTPPTRAGKALAVFEAGVGFGFIAVVIGYLPVLYQLFSQREARVMRLDARAGSPPTAAALLERHAGPQGMASLGTLLADWEQAAVELVESHLSYPMLAYYRSQHDHESWLAGVAAVADASALLMTGLGRAGNPNAPGHDDVPRFQARMTFAAARLAVVEIARVLAAVPPDPPPSAAASDRLPRAAFRELEARLCAAGLVWRDPAAAERALARARAEYEPHLAALSERLALPLPAWLRAPDAPDNWEQDADGARALYDEAEAEEVGAARRRR